MISLALVCTMRPASAARLGFTPEQAVGQSVMFNNYAVNVVGVLANAKFVGAREPVKPTASASSDALQRRRRFAVARSSP